MNINRRTVSFSMSEVATLIMLLNSDPECEWAVAQRFALLDELWKVRKNRAFVKCITDNESVKSMFDVAIKSQTKLLQQQNEARERRQRIDKTVTEIASALRRIL